MNRYFTRYILLKCLVWAGIILPFSALFSAFSAHAAYDDQSVSPRSAFQQMDRSSVISYVRHQAIGLLPTKTIMAPLRQVKQQFQGVQDFFGMGDHDVDSAMPNEENTTMAFFSDLWRPGKMDVKNDAFWLTPGYHHNSGIMPWKDSLTLGFNYERHAMRDRMKIKVKPYIGQGWARGGSIWGAEASMSLGQREDIQQPMATISFRYDDGDPSLAGDQRGFDVHGDWAIKRNLNLTIGARAREGEDHSGYALVRWRWAIDGSSF